jgi:glycosyltransferase involved in cell wall biosynthesis
VRLAVYTDYAYHRVDDEVYAERAFALFLGALRPQFERLVLVGRLAPGGGADARYPVGAGVDLVGLPFYPSLANPLRAVPTFARSVGAFWRALAGVDCVWLLGPHPLAIAFAVLARLRGKRVVLGVRQDLPEYVRNRHPGRRSLRLAAWLLERAFRLLGRFAPVVVVGPGLAANYRGSRELLEIAVSLIREEDVVPPERALERAYDGELVALSVGRLEEEKNPLLLADVLAALSATGRRWRLVVCGEGALEGALRARLDELGQADRAELRGYVPFGAELLALYRQSHVLLHTSWTEGFPAVLPEAFAAGLPIVAADVGGIAGAVGEAVLLVPPGDATAAAAAVESVVRDPATRQQLVRNGNAYVAAHTLEAETARLAAFLRATRPSAPTA